MGKCSHVSTLECDNRAEWGVKRAIRSRQSVSSFSSSSSLQANSPAVIVSSSLVSPATRMELDAKEAKRVKISLEGEESARAAAAAVVPLHDPLSVGCRAYEAFRPAAAAAATGPPARALSSVDVAAGRSSASCCAHTRS